VESRLKISTQAREDGVRAEGYRFPLSRRPAEVQLRVTEVMWRLMDLLARTERVEPAPAYWFETGE